MRLTLALIALAAFPASAQDDLLPDEVFQEGSTARPWNLFAEYPAFFEARVTDALCELTGDCPEDCGAGSRQMVLVRTVDDVMVLPLKNSQPAFTGAAVELAPFCNQTVEVDGLLLEDDFVGATNVYLVQKIRVVGTEEWTTANRWTKEWAKANPDAAGPGPWFRRDPAVLAEIEREGYLGLGADADQAYIEEWLQ